MKEIAGCLIEKNGKIFLLHRKDKDHWELPGGKIKEGETPEEAAKRETKEEINCEVRILKYKGYKDFKMKNEKIRSHQFYAEITKGKPRITEKTVFDKIDLIDLNNKNINLAPNIK